MDFGDALVIGYCMARNKKGGGSSSDDDWKPPEDWLSVPEPTDYEIYLLIDVIKIDENSRYNYLRLMLSRPSDCNTGYGTLAIDWGDGTVDSWAGYNEETGDYSQAWSNSKLEHTYNNIGQYIVKVSTTAQSCFLQRISADSGYLRLLIAKCGIEITLNNDELIGSDYSTQDGFKSHQYLQYVKIGGKGGLPRINGFRYCYSLQKIDITIPPTIITANTFDECYNLKNFDFSKVIEIKNCGLENSYFNKLNLPKCTTIGEYGMNLSKTVEEIIAPMCISVGNRAFSGNYRLKKVVFAEDCAFGTDCFQNCYVLYHRPDGSTN